MFKLYHESSATCSKVITQTYSTSFSLGIKALHPRFRNAIYGIYGMVRYADEIVDTFHQFNKKELLKKFKADTLEAIETGMSLNPILYSYQHVVNTYNIPNELTEAFFSSMETDLYETAHGRKGYEEYIYGSAEVVGLMCLCVFTEGDRELYNQLKPAARALGAAFQKVNFLRDMKDDFTERGRTYFPGIDFYRFKDEAKRTIESEITADFEKAYDGIMQLPAGARAGVLLAYKYYLRLFNEIKKTPAETICKARVSVPNINKLILLISTLATETVRNFSFRIYPSKQGVL